MKRKSWITRTLSLGLGLSLLSTVTLAASGTSYSGTGADITAPAGQEATLIVDGTVTRFDGVDQTFDQATVVYTDDVDSADDRLSSFTAGGTDETDNDYAYHTALFVDDTGVVDSKSVTQAIGDGATYDETHAENVTIRSTDPSFNGIMVSGGIQYTIAKATITFDTDGDGRQSCDFSGKGTAIAAYGEGTKVTVEDSDISVSGVANMTLFADSGATMTVRNSKLHSAGGTLHEGYLNSPSQNTMVAPPWILGIMGNSRCTNLEGNYTTMNFIDCETSAAKWAVLSTDSGSNMKLNIVNTTMDLTGSDQPIQADDTYEDADGDPNPFTSRSGYGTYVIGSADEQFLGVTMNVGTYGSIFTGGTGTYTSLEKGQTYELLDANGQVSETYEATEDKITTINSDTFGFMSHQGTDTITLEKGTQVNSVYASLLMKNTQGDTVVNVTSGASLNPDNGILMQVMDNDDSTTGMDTATFSFNTTHQEPEGWPSENGNVSTEMTQDTGNVAAGDVEGMIGADGTMGGEAPMGDPPEGGPMGDPPDGGPGGAGGDGGDGGSSGPVVDQLNVTDSQLVGDIYNGSGYYGETAVGVEVNLGENAVLTGLVAQTETIHTDATQYTSQVLPAGTSAQEAGQLTSFTIAQYYNIGHVANRYYNNGDNTLTVNLTDNAVWNVTGDCLLSTLSLGENATLAAQDGTLIMTVDGVETEIAPGTYQGEIWLTYTPDPQEPETVTDAPEEASADPEAPAAVTEAPASTQETPAETSAEAPTSTQEETTSTQSAAPIVVVVLIVVAAAVVAVVLKKKKK
jgi:hypothetical protein